MPVEAAVSDVARAVATYHAALARREAAAWRDLARTFADARRVAHVALMRAAAQAAAHPGDAGYAFTEARAAALVRELEAAYRTAAMIASGSTATLVTDAASLGTQAGSAAGVYATWVTASPAAVATLAGASATGAPVAALFAALGPDAATAAVSALRTGVALGWNPRRTARAMLDAADTLARHRALTIARTESLRAFRTSSLAGYAASGVVGGWVWVCALDTRTCAACWAMHGTAHPLDEAMAAHPNCRCRVVPLPDVPQSVLDRIVGGVGSGAERFARLPAADQRAILGATRHRLYQSGALPLERVVGYASSPVWGRSVRVRALSASQRRAAARRATAGRR